MGWGEPSTPRPTGSPWPRCDASITGRFDQLARVTRERDHLRVLLARALEHIDPNDSDEDYRLLLECQAAVESLSTVEVVIEVDAEPTVEALRTAEAACRWELDR